jgi:hypothetical protein
MIGPLVTIAVGLTGFGLYQLFTAPHKIFISYSYQRAAAMRRLLAAWNRTPRFDIKFIDYSADISIKSENEGVIKRAISAKINKSDYFIALIDSKIRDRKMVLWEIKKAIELNKPIIAIKVEKGAKLPRLLHGYKTKVILQKMKYQVFKDAIVELDNI